MDLAGGARSGVRVQAQFESLIQCAEYVSEECIRRPEAVRAAARVGCLRPTAGARAASVSKCTGWGWMCPARGHVISIAWRRVRSELDRECLLRRNLASEVNSVLIKPGVSGITKYEH